LLVERLVLVLPYICFELLLVEEQCSSVLVE